MKRIFWTSIGMVFVFITLAAIEIFTGGNSLYKWDVQVSINVRDGKTGKLRSLNKTSTYELILPEVRLHKLNS